MLTLPVQVLYDWQRGKIPYFAVPPGHTEEAPSDGATAPAAQLADADAPEQVCRGFRV